MRVRGVLLVAVIVVAALATAKADDVTFIKQAYQDLLGRAPSNSDVNFAVVFLGSDSRTDFASFLDTSAEYRGILINNLYQEFLGRAADPTGLATFQAYLGSGGTDEGIITQLAGSSEFFSHVGGTDLGAINALFSDLLHRTPTSFETTYWENFLISGTLGGMATDLTTSAEYYDLLVNTWFSEFLHRSPTPTELAFWVGQLDPVLTDEQAVSQIVGSDEYYNLAAQEQAPGPGQVPEPATASLLLLGAAGLARKLRRRL